MKLILASNSPRRRELLLELVNNFDVIPSNFDEIITNKSAKDTVRDFARGKTENVFLRYPDCAILGADTIVTLDNRILGKPKDKDDATNILRTLSGRCHDVFSGICLMTPKGIWESVELTRVYFNNLSEEIIASYVDSGLPMDKAGSYGIQDPFPLVKNYEGSYTNVVGLPMEKVSFFLKKANIL